jgi:hypothetical protein
MLRSFGSDVMEAGLAKQTLDKSTGLSVLSLAGGWAPRAMAVTQQGMLAIMGHRMTSVPASGSSSSEARCKVTFLYFVWKVPARQ